MKVLLYSRNGQYPQNLETLVKATGLEISSPNIPNSPDIPDVIITFGGDGTLIGAERDHPGIPKLPIKNSGVGYHTIQLPPEETLKLLLANKLQIKEYFKLELYFQDKKYLALNEIAVRNELATSALRFTVSLPNTPNFSNFSNTLIGDGIIIATPFGSTGYFYSISGQTFETGIGLAYNNIHNTQVKDQIVREAETVSVRIIRGPAELTVDNNPQIIILKDNESVEIKKSSQIARIYTLG